MARRRPRSVSTRAWGAGILAALFLLVVTSAVGRLIGSERVLEGLEDWTRHVGLYFLLTLAVGIVACAVAGGIRPAPLLFALALCAGYGIFQEIRQSELRAPLEWHDVAWDAMGVVAATALLAVTGAVLHRARLRRRP
jgi:VanZ family protein